MNEYEIDGREKGKYIYMSHLVREQAKNHSTKKGKKKKKHLITEGLGDWSRKCDSAA